MGVTVYNDEYGFVSTMTEDWYAGAPRIFNPLDGTLGAELPVPDSGGGIAINDGKMYIGVRDISDPGLYIVDIATMTLYDKKPTSLQPYSIIYFENDIITRIAEPEEAPTAFSVEQAYPNPFNSSMTISFTLSVKSNVTVDIYNIAGQKVDTLLNSFLKTDNH